MGDPVEATSVGNVFGEPRGIYIGSVKPNLGHSEASAGISSLMKAVLALEHKTIPPNIKFKVPNPRSKSSRPLSVDTSLFVLIRIPQFHLRRRRSQSP